VTSGDQSPPGDTVFVRGISFEGNHGYTAAERRSTRRFRVNVVMELSLAAASVSDKISDTVDYFRISECVVEIGTRSTFRLLERLAGEMARAIQEMYPRAGVTVELEKLLPPCPGVPEASGVRLYLPPGLAPA
jgi:dihydroneopterin aldolase